MLYLGTSKTGASTLPSIIYEERGITGYNLFTMMATPATMYYQLLNALQYQTPKVVVLDYNGLLATRDADDVAYAATYSVVVNNIKNPFLKWDVVRDIVKHNESQSVLYYYFPLLRDHSRWTSLRESDFIRVLTYYNGQKGMNLYLSAEEHAFPEVFPVVFQQSLEVQPESVEYYDRIIELCRSKGIQVAAVMAPQLWYTTDEADVYASFSEEKGVPFCDFNSKERVEEIGLDPKTDYVDQLHLNSYGGAKVSAFIARWLDEQFDLPDHRGDPAYAQWDEAVQKLHLKLWHEQLQEE